MDGMIVWTRPQGEPGLARLQCLKERSVCTVTSLQLDEELLVAGLGSSGRVEVWDRRENTRLWSVVAHSEGEDCVLKSLTLLMLARLAVCSCCWCSECQCWCGDITQVQGLVLTAISL